MALAAVALAAAPNNPVTWKLEPVEKPVKAGARFTVKLNAEVLDGWHFYSMKTIDDGPVPVRIWLADGQPFQLAGPIEADEPQRLEDPTLHMEVELYEGSAAFTLPLKVTAGTSAGAHTLEVSAQTQSCNNSMCLPPTTVRVTVPVTITK
jgi:DsbC/DsbD-like thiol-disulfide interchange protein